MRKNSKPPEERRRELVTVASHLFQEKGYEAVSVRDILDAVHGAPGMFYYYFKSKQDIYLATIEQYLSERIKRRCRVLEDANVSFDEKQAAFHQLLQEDIAGYMQRFQQGRDRSITDDSYKLWDFMQLLNRFGVFSPGRQSAVQRHGRKRHGALVPLQLRPRSENMAIFLPGILPYPVGGILAQQSREPLSEAPVKPLSVQRIHWIVPRSSIKSWIWNCSPQLRRVEKNDGRVGWFSISVHVHF